jgi:hypothetical protein
MVMLRVVMLSVDMLRIVMLYVVILSVFILSVVMLIVVALKKQPGSTFIKKDYGCNLQKLMIASKLTIEGTANVLSCLQCPNSY